MATVQALDHVGIRVHDLSCSVAFYEKFGFALVLHEAQARVAIMRHPEGMEINFILNAGDDASENILMDVPTKHPGYTHIALRIASIEETLAELAQHDIVVSDGPIKQGPWKTSLFVRDPDNNVIELTHVEEAWQKRLAEFHQTQLINS